MVYRLFIVDEERFKYLEEVLCKGEITKNLPIWGYSSVRECGVDNLPGRFRVINLLNPDKILCNSLVPHNLKIDTRWLGEVVTSVEGKGVRSAPGGNGQCTSSLYTKTRFIGDKGQENVKVAKRIHPYYYTPISICYILKVD